MKTPRHSTLRRRAAAATPVAVLAALCATALWAASEADGAGTVAEISNASTEIPASANDSDIPAFVATSVKPAYRMAPGGAGLLLIDETLASRPVARVREVRATPQADIVTLDRAKGTEFRVGMRFQIFPANAPATTKGAPAPIGEVILVATNADRAAALVLDIAPGATFRTGDTAIPKLLEL